MLADLLNFPFDSNMILRKKRALRKELLLSENTMNSCRIALLGGSTTTEIRDVLELFLLKIGIQPSFYESQFNQFFEEAVFETAPLDAFNPQVVIIHSGIVNIEEYPEITDSEAEVDNKIQKTVDKYETIWSRLSEKYHCEIIQNNFELPHNRILGNLDTVDFRGRVNFVLNLNREFSFAARKNRFLHINDVHYLSAMIGAQAWFDLSLWCLYKYALSYTAIPVFCNSVATIIGAILGKSKKLLVLDLDNTLWGGVIGDDGAKGIKLGRDDPQGEAYAAFQEYIKSLKNRGVMLAVCSKNEMASAREGLLHPDSVLKIDDFAMIKASWGAKDTAINDIAKELNVGLDSIVFVDDNPVERELVAGNVPDVQVPNVGSDIVNFTKIIDQAGFFEPVALSNDDVHRNEYYNQNSKRAENLAKYVNHDEYLQSLQMSAEISEFSGTYLERIVQLTNKTNQFNLTVKRYTQTAIEEVLGNPLYIGLYGKLSDKFGDNGLVSVLLGRIDGQSAIHIDLWVMSCRVFNRELECALFDEFVGRCVARGIVTIYGYYTPSAKNGLVADLYARFGFNKVSENEAGESLWEFTPTLNYKRLTAKIEIRGV